MKLMANHSIKGIMYREESILYSDILAHITKMAGKLPVEPGDTIAILGENSPGWIYSLYAIWKKESIAVPLDITFSKSELHHIILETKPAMILCDEELKPLIKEAAKGTKVRPKVMAIEKNPPEAPKGPVEEFILDNMKRPALILYHKSPEALFRETLTFTTIISAMETPASMMKHPGEHVAAFPLWHLYHLQWAMAAMAANQTVVVTSLPVNFADMKDTTIVPGTPAIFEEFHRKTMDHLQQKLITRTAFLLASLIPSSGRKIIFHNLLKLPGEGVNIWISGEQLPRKIVQDLKRTGWNIRELNEQKLFLAKEGHGRNTTKETP
jgi:long-subunit acyl-CoA synthetase (AMP-forming)